MTVRRVVTITGTDGKARVQTDTPAPRSRTFDSVPGFCPTLVWSTPPDATVGQGSVEDPTPQVPSWVPAQGGTRLMVVTFPPDSVMAQPGFDPAAFGAEFGATMPGLAECFEVESSGMHRTESVDYDVVLDGEIVLELDDGHEVVLKQHDMVVQNGTRHAWRNKSDKPATLLFVLVGARRQG